MIFSKTRNFLLSLLLSLGLFGCHSLTFLSFAFPVSVSVSQLSEKSEGTVIYLRGIVKDRAPFLGKGAYQLEDTTGQVWVITQDPLPETGQEITLKGQIEYKAIPIAGQDLGEFYLLELEKVANVPQETPQEVQPVSIPQNDPSVDSPPPPQPKPSPSLNDLFFPQKQNDK